MICDVAAEFVSALCDGEIIPREAAEHIGSCEECKARLRDYTELSTELRRLASVALEEEPRPLEIRQKRRAVSNLWWQGWKAVRVPRLAFAALLAGFAILGFSVAMVKVRAHSEGNVVMLSVAPSQGPAEPCPLSMLNKKKQVCSWADRDLTYEIKLLSKDDDRIKLGIRVGPVSRRSGITTREVDNFPERQYSFAPGETLKIEVPGYGPIVLTGEWMDYMPYFGELDLEHNLEPSPDELRIVSPVLIRGKQMVVDLGGDSVWTGGKDDLVYFYTPDDGLYELSLTPLPGAVQAYAENNRVSFEIDGKPYLLLTGDPIARTTEVWILHTPGVKPSSVPSGSYGVGTEMLNHLIPRSPIAK